MNKGAQAAQLAELLNSNKQIDLRDLWQRLWRRKWLIFSISFVFLIGSAIYAVMFIRPVYQVSATITIQSTSVLNTSLRGMGSQINTSLDRARILRKAFSPDYLNQMAELLDLRNNAKIIATAKSFQNSARWITFDDAMERSTLAFLRNKLEIAVTHNGDQFHVAVRDTSPLIAFEMVDAMTNIFVTKSRQSDLRGIRDVKEFSEGQLAVYKQKMDESEKKLREFNERMAADQAKDVVMSKDALKQLGTMKTETEDAISDRMKQLARFEKQIPPKVISQLSDKLVDLDRMQAKLRDKMQSFERDLIGKGWNSSAEMQANNDINLIRLESNRIISKAIDEVFPNKSVEQKNLILDYSLANLDLYILQNRLGSITRVFEKYIKSVASQPAVRLEQKKLENDYEQNRHTYELFLDQSRGTQIEEAIQNSDAEYKYQVVNPPEMPIYAVGGSKKTFVLMALALSLALGFGLVFVLEFLDQTIRSENDVKQFLGLPILGTIPKMDRSFEDYYANFVKLHTAQQKPPKNGSAAEQDKLNLDLASADSFHPQDSQHDSEAKIVAADLLSRLESSRKK